MNIIKPRIIEIFDVWIKKAGGTIPPGIALIAAQKMWPDTQGEHTVVAVIDTGIDYEHPDLKKNVVGGAGFIHGFKDKDYMDENGHGTHVAGIIAAQGALLGVAPHTKLLAVKVLDKNGQGSFTNIARGVAWARKWRGPAGEKVNVINLSLGGPLSHTMLYDEIKKAVGDGISVVCAAGNSGDGDPDTDEISYPAYYPETIAVGAVDNQTGLANFSNSNDRINVVAPGVETYSTYPGGRYVKLSGTSMAAPHVSGAVALICSRFYNRFGHYPSPPYVKELLDYMAVDLKQIGFNKHTGFGLFSFNIDGGKAYKFHAGQDKYQINHEAQSLKSVPVLQNGELYMALRELSELMGAVCDMPDPEEAELWV